MYLDKLNARIKRTYHNTSDFAEEVGMSYYKVRRILRGEQPLTVDDFLIISKTLYLTPQEKIEILS